MLRMTFLIFIGFVLSACEPADKAEVANQTTNSEASTEDASSDPVAYYEYLWCKRGENWTQEASLEFVTDWNAEIDKLENTSSAFGYGPRGWTDDRFDGLWVLRWPDKATSEAGWSEYQASGAQDRLDAKYPAHLECGNTPGADRFGFEVYTPMGTPDGFAVNHPVGGEPYFLENQFCSYKEGKSADDLRSVVMGEFVPNIESGRADGMYASYWFLVGAPDFEGEDVADFNWINFWDSAEDAQRESSFFEESEEGKAIMENFYGTVDCTEFQPWDGYVIRMADPA
mgnify:FL=1